VFLKITDIAAKSCFGTKKNRSFLVQKNLLLARERDLVDLVNFFLLLASERDLVDLVDFLLFSCSHASEIL